METVLEKLAAEAAGHAPALPLKLLVVADCAGHEFSGSTLAAETSSGLMETLKPALTLHVENRLQTGGPRLTLNLEFQRIDDFHPTSLVARVGALAEAARAGHPALPEQLDSIIHHPGYQRLEACWRGLERLSAACRSSESIRLEVLPAARENLRQRFHEAVFEPEYEGGVGIPLSAVLFDFRFSHETEEIALLEALGGDCSRLQVPMVAAAQPGFFQLKNLAHLPNLPDLAGRFQLPAYFAWRRFQTDPVARWVCITANRYLARQPYVIAAGAGSPFEYREKADAAHPEQYLWADAGWLALCNLARSFARYHHCAIIDGMAPETTHVNLPVRPFPKKANVFVPSPTEILVDDDKAWELVRGGISTLVGISDGAVATFPFLANVYRLRPGVLTVESALSYQLFAAHFAHYVMGLYPELPLDSGSEAVLAFVRSRLREFLVPLSGGNPEEAVRAEIRETPGDPKGRILDLSLRPVLKMQGKDIEFTLQITL